MIETICLWIGRVFCCIGGAIVAGFVLLGLGHIAANIAADLVWKYHAISAVERNVHFYRRNKVAIDMFISAVENGKVRRNKNGDLVPIFDPKDLEENEENEKNGSDNN